MVCIYCGSETNIYNSRYLKKSNQTWRRHRCQKCNATFTTLETPLLDSLWMIKGSNGLLSPFRQNKLLISVYTSCKHRKTALDDAAGLTSTIINRLKPEKNKVVIELETIKQTVYSVLNRFDKVAAVQYKAYHKFK